jgi:hypothetical protein
MHYFSGAWNLMDPLIPRVFMVRWLDLHAWSVMPQYTDTIIQPQIFFRWVSSDKRQQMVIDKVDAGSWVQNLDTSKQNIDPRY